MLTASGYLKPIAQETHFMLDLKKLNPKCAVVDRLISE
jgi:hypothetical protein